MVITFTSDEGIVSISSWNCVVTAISVDDIVVSCTGDIIITVRHCIGKAHLSQILNGAVSKLQIFYTVVVIIELIIKLNTLCLISIYIDIQIIARAFESQVIKRNAFTKFYLICSAFGIAVLIIGKSIKSISQIPDVDIVTSSALNMIIPFASDKDIVSIAGTNCVITTISVDDIIVSCTGNVIMTISLLESEPHFCQIFNASISKF